MSSNLPDGINTSPSYNEGMGCEAIVAEELRKAGFVIVCQNFRLGQKETDIIALEDGVLCFIEVKARSNPGYLRDLDQLIPKTKRNDMVSIAAYFSKANRALGFKEIRFDFALLRIPRPGEEPHVTYYRNAFIPGANGHF